MKEYESYLVICPFYKAETPETIRCEAPIEGTLGQVVRFRLTAKKEAWHEKICCDEYHKCPYVQELEKYWEEKLKR